MKRIIAVLFALALAACASTPDKIVSVPAFSPPPTAATKDTPVVAAPAPLPVAITNPTIIDDLKGATDNLDQAVAIGALPANDPAPKCFHDVLKQAGIEVPPGTAPPASFTPHKDGLASLGSILYIQIQQAKAMQNAATALQVTVDCKALLGQFVLDGAAGLNKVGKTALGLSGLGAFGVTGGLLLPGVGLVRP